MADCWQPQASFTGSQWISPENPQYMHTSALYGSVYAFPRPRPTRVTKPHSAGNSPSNAGRRRITMPRGATAYRPVPNKAFSTAFDAALLASAFRERKSRPMSWHCTGYAGTCASYLPTSALAVPASLEAPANYGNLDSFQPFDASAIPCSGDYVSALSSTQVPAPLQQSAFLAMSGSQVDPVAWDGVPGLSASSQAMPDSWPFDMMSMSNGIPSSDEYTGPATPDFLPIQQFDDDFKNQPDTMLDSQEPGDELVGMGLYSEPDVYLEHPARGVSGKGLKLEETFTPSSDNEADDGDAEDEEDEDNEQPAQENPELQGSQEAAVDMLNKSFLADNDDLQGQQLTNLNTQTGMDYGYGWI